MANERPVRNYDGNYITCYPGSNQTDDGKINLEFNMARFVTRLSSRNFCVVKPSYELTKFNGSGGKPQIQVGVGQCSINGMDLIMTQTLTIDAPEQAGTFYLGFKLARDSSNNVLGDSVYGVTRTFEGVYLTYFDEKVETSVDPDRLYLGKVVYDGTNITTLEDDPDKYGRISAEDIICKLLDPKHPDITSIILQDWIYKVPDWYVSKEGDVEYGEIDFMATRDTEGTYGIHIQAKNDNNSELIIKAPSLGTNETNRILKTYATNNGIEIDIGQSKIKSNTSNSYAIDLTTPNKININSQSDVSIIGQTSLSLGVGSNGLTPKMLLKNNKVTVTSSVASGLKDEIVIASNSVQHTIGKSILQYTSSNSKLSLLASDTNEFDVVANTDLQKSARVIEKLYIGSGTFNSQKTWLASTEWNLQNSNSKTNMVPGQTTMTADGSNAWLKVQKTDNTGYANITNDGYITLYNSTSNTPPKIYLNNGSYNVTLKQTSGTKGNGTGTVSILDITAGHTKFSGDITATGEIRASKVYNAVYNDIVEFMEKENYNEEIEAGDIVYFNESGKVSKYHEGINPTAIAGIVSSEETYGYALGGNGLEDNQKVPVALKGRVYVKTDNTNFKPGDFVSVDSCGCVYKGDPHVFDIFTLGIATMPEKDGKVFVMIK